MQNLNRKEKKINGFLFDKFQDNLKRTIKNDDDADTNNK